MRKQRHDSSGSSVSVGKRRAKGSATESWDSDYSWDGETETLQIPSQGDIQRTSWPNASALTLSSIASRGWSDTEDDPTIVPSRRAATPSLTSEGTAFETDDDTETEGSPTRRWSARRPFDFGDNVRIIPLRANSRARRPIRQPKESSGSSLSSSTSSRESDAAPLDVSTRQRKLKRRSRSNTVTEVEDSSGGESLLRKTASEVTVPFPPSPKQGPPPVRRHRASPSLTSIILPSSSRSSSSSSGGFFSRARAFSKSKRPSPEPPASPRPLTPAAFSPFTPTFPASTSTATIRPGALDLSLSQATIRARPATASPASAYFSVCGSSSSAEVEAALAAPSPTRRVSLNDLRIPSRIVKAQAKIGQDVERLREFKRGVEDLKELRRTFRSLISTAQHAEADDEDTMAPRQGSFDKMQTAMRRIESQYARAWDSCDVLIELADGADEADGLLGGRRERSISMFPRTDDLVATMEAGERQLAVLKGVLSPQSAFADTFRDAGQQTPARPPAHTAHSSPAAYTLVAASPPRRPPVVKPPSTKYSLLGHASRLSMTSLRGLLRNLRRGEATTMAETTAVSEDVQADEEEDDWDSPPTADVDDRLPRARTHSVASTAPIKLGQAPPWPADAQLELTPEGMPTLLAYLREVQEGCRSSLKELREITF